MRAQILSHYLAKMSGGSAFDPDDLFARLKAESLFARILLYSIVLITS